MGPSPSRFLSRAPLCLSPSAAGLPASMGSGGPCANVRALRGKLAALPSRGDVQALGTWAGPWGVNTARRRFVGGGRERRGVPPARTAGNDATVQAPVQSASRSDGHEYLTLLNTYKGIVPQDIPVPLASRSRLIS